MTRKSLIWFVGLALTGCGKASPDNQAQTDAAGPSAPNCLPQVWAARPPIDRTFDLRSDNHGPYSFSCDARTSASAVRQALVSLQTAARNHDKSAISSLLHYPFFFIDGRGRRSQIASAVEFERQANAILTPDVYAAIQDASLANGELARSQGIAFSLGGLWFLQEGVGAEPRLGTINHQSLRIARRR
jgi:hypothetical protein